MAEFMVNTDMFGMYVRIPTGYSREMHIYKVVSKFKTNSYCDVPIVYGSKPVPHEKEYHDLSDLEDVLNVIHCGIDETEVIRVALKDCEIVTPVADIVPGIDIKALFAELDETLHNVAMEYADAGHMDYFAVCENIHHKVLRPVEKKYTGGSE